MDKQTVQQLIEGKRAEYQQLGTEALSLERTALLKREARQAIKAELEQLGVQVRENEAMSRLHAAQMACEEIQRHCAAHAAGLVNLKQNTESELARYKSELQTILAEARSALDAIHKSVETNPPDAA